MILDKIFKHLPEGYGGFEIELPCYDCKKMFSLKIAKIDGVYTYAGGSIYDITHDLQLFKCDSCFEKCQTIEYKKITECEVYSRVVGYLRPVEQWNNGKQAEFNDRKSYKIT